MTDIPRQLSIELMQDDPDLYTVGSRVQVWLNGVKQDACIRYDMDKGEIERYAKNEDGTIKHTAESYTTEVVRGKVEVTLREEHA